MSIENRTEASDLEKITLELWSAVSDLSRVVERLTDADDADISPIRTALDEAANRINKGKLVRLGVALS